jgi:hypothetical protein
MPQGDELIEDWRQARAATLHWRAAAGERLYSEILPELSKAAESQSIDAAGGNKTEPPGRQQAFNSTDEVQESSGFPYDGKHRWPSLLFGAG